MDEKLTKKTVVLIKVSEYDLLLKKAELYDKLISNKAPKPQEGGSLTQIVATQAFNEGLLKPTSSKGKQFHLFYFKKNNQLTR